MTKKPYIEQPDSCGSKSEEEVADTWWQNHLKRDRSMVQSLFMGQFKSVTRCRNPGEWGLTSFFPANRQQQLT